MYAQQAFREDRPEVLLEAMRDIGAVSLVTHSNDGLVSTLMPVLIGGAPEHPMLIGHIAKANPQWKVTDTSKQALAIAIGPNDYISPNWYPSKQVDGEVVPTWNFVHIQAHGSVEFIEDRDECLAIVTALTDHHEAPSEKPWAVSDAPQEFTDVKLRGIVGVRIMVERLEGSFKLSQNQSADNRSGVLEGLNASPTPRHVALAEVMTQIR
ncbi:MAG: FMN-binding negative transcriptional regulator [Acidimicrobiales bacterium]|jgi:transcriptional regulator